MPVENFRKNMDTNKLENNKEIKEENIPEFSSLEELDPKLFNLIKDVKIDIPDFSKSIKKNVMADYRKYYRYGILWRKIKIKIQDLKDFIYEHLPGKLESAFVSLAILAILAGIAYYQYANSKGMNQGNLISNQQIPKINTTVNPITSPSPTPSIAKEGAPKIIPNTSIPIASKDTIPDIANNDKLNNGNSIDSKNNQPQKNDTLAINPKQNEKHEEIKGIKDLENKVTENRYEKNIKIPPLSNDREIKDSNTNNINNNQVKSVAEISKISVDLFATVNNQHIKIDSSEKQWLDKLNSILVKEINQLKGKYQWEVVSEEKAQVGLQVDTKEQDIFLVNLNGEEIWKMSLTGYAKEPPEITANKIIQQLRQNIIASLNNNN